MKKLIAFLGHVISFLEHVISFLTVVSSIREEHWLYETESEHEHHMRYFITKNTHGYEALRYRYGWHFWMWLSAEHPVIAVLIAISSVIAIIVLWIIALYNYFFNPIF